MSVQTADFVRNALDFFIGQTTPAEMHVAVRLPAELARDGWAIRGQVVGPTCCYSRTLLARIPLFERNQADDLLSLAIVPDPCFWTPAMPFLYRVEVTLVQDGVELPTLTREIGVRPLTTRGRSLLLEGKSWVLRGARSSSVATYAPGIWHESDMAQWIRSPSDEQCRVASRIGMLLAVEIPASVPTLESELRRLVAYPAVGLIVITSEPKLSVSIVSTARGAILVERLPNATAQPSPWAQAVLCDATDEDALRQVAAASRLPVIVERKLDQPALDPGAARLECDRLQRDLAGPDNFAGYLV